MSERFTICTNADLSQEAAEYLKRGVGEHSLVFAKNRAMLLATAVPGEEFATCQIAHGQPAPEELIGNPNLKWVQITSAGYTRYDTPEFKSAMQSKGAAFCNSSSVYADPCAQHILAFMLAQARQIPGSIRSQLHGAISSFEELRPKTRVLGGLVLIVGYGAIGRRLTELLAPFNMQPIAFRRSVQGDEPLPCYPISDLESWLPKADHVVNILPANDDSARFFNAARFAYFKPGAIFYNIGRGATVDQSALIDALKSGQVGAAMLDVTDPEPLPADHPLWSAPNCTITPHIGGGFGDESMASAKHLLANLKHFENREALTDRVF